MKANCPRCNSLQKFSKRREDHGGLAKVFIRCRMCHYEKLIFSGSSEQADLKSDIDKLTGKVLRGDPLSAVLKKRQERFRSTCT